MTTMKLVKPEPLINEPDISSLMACQEEFHKVYEIPTNADTQELYVKLIEEEHEEWVEDYYNINAPEYQELKELADLLYVTCGLAYQLGFKINKAVKFAITEYYDYSITDLVSEVATGKKDKLLLSNLIYCIFGYAHSMNWDLPEAYNRVHKSNLSKLGEDGKPVRREDGKVLKGKNYIAPELTDLTNGK